MNLVNHSPSGGGNPFDQSLNTTDTPTFANFTDGSHSFASLFDGTGGYVVYARYDGDTGYPLASLFDGSGGNVAYASGALNANYANSASNASFAANPSSEFNSFFHNSGFNTGVSIDDDVITAAGFIGKVNLTANVAAFTIDGTDYYPHVTAGVLSFTSTP